MRDTISLLKKVNRMFEYIRYSVEVRIMDNQAVYFLVRRYDSGEKTYTRFWTLGTLNLHLREYTDSVKFMWVRPKKGDEGNV